MVRIMILVTFCFLCVAGTAPAQPSQTQGAESLLEELGTMLAQTPQTTEECHALLTRLREWQAEKIRQLKDAQFRISITAPMDGGVVRERPLCTGTVGTPTAQVWVIVHPMEVADYWVQSPVTVKEDGSWKVILNIGRPGKVDVGKRFEIMAIAEPRTSLSTGQVLPGWPSARARSSVIEVQRQ